MHQSVCADASGSGGSGGSVHLINKPVGMTPLEALRRFTAQRNGPPQKLSYAGRLDPLACGLLLCLEGAECARQEEQQNHDKCYHWEALLGLQTDSYDVLGLCCSDTRTVTSRQQLVEQATHTLQTTLVGSFEQPYPPYSGIRVDGKPLFWWAQQQRLHEIKIPVITATVLSTEVTLVRWVSVRHLRSEIARKIGLVQGEFRQEQCLQRWNHVFDANYSPDDQFPILSVRSRVRSGTYIRNLANRVGGLAWSICRVSVGSHVLNDCWNVEPCSEAVYLQVLQILHDKNMLPEEFKTELTKRRRRE